MQSDTAGLSASVFLPVLGSAALAAAIKYIYIYMHMYMCVCIMHVRTCIHTYIPTYLPTYIHMCMFVSNKFMHVYGLTYA